MGENRARIEERERAAQLVRDRIATLDARRRERLQWIDSVDLHTTSTSSVADWCDEVAQLEETINELRMVRAAIARGVA